MLGRFLAVAVSVGLCAVAWLVCGTSVAEAKAPKRLPLGVLERITGTWSITVTDCTACLVSSQRNGQLDVSQGSLTGLHAGLDVFNNLVNRSTPPGADSPLRAVSW
jgi:hypothetical protein